MRKWLVRAAWVVVLAPVIVIFLALAIAQPLPFAIVVGTVLWSLLVAWLITQGDA
jgi:hypothetical protein